MHCQCKNFLCILTYFRRLLSIFKGYKLMFVQRTCNCVFRSPGDLNLFYMSGHTVGFFWGALCWGIFTFVGVMSCHVQGDNFKWVFSDWFSSFSFVLFVLVMRVCWVGGQGVGFKDPWFWLYCVCKTICVFGYFIFFFFGFNLVNFGFTY